MKVFLQRSLAILEENGDKHKIVMDIIASLEENVAKWRATTKIVWRLEHPRLANATVAFIEAVKLNHQLSSRVDDVFAKLGSIRLDNDEVFGRYKDTLRANDDLACEGECFAKEREALDATMTESVRVVFDLQAQQRDFELLPSNT